MIEAVVQIGGVETLYRRAGRGPRVLVLGEPVGPSATVGLFEYLAGHFRTIAPVLGGNMDAGGGGREGSPELWLRGLVDGLGLERPAIIADEASAHVLLRFAIGDPGRVDRIVLVGNRGSETAPGAVLMDALREGGHPILLLRIPPLPDSEGREEALVRLLAFLKAAPLEPRAHGGFPVDPQEDSASRTFS